MKLSSFNLFNSSLSLRLSYKILSGRIVNDSSCFIGVICYDFSAYYSNEVELGNTIKYTFDYTFSDFPLFISGDVLNYFAELIIFS